MDVRTKNEIHFGLLCPTHKKVANTVIADYPKLKPYKQIFEKFVQQPDYDEAGFLGMQHNYQGHEKVNALTLYTEHVEEMKKAFKEHELQKAMEHAARALHFLHDSAIDKHLEKKSIFKELIDLPGHVAYEGFVHKNFDKLTASYKKKQYKMQGLKQIFLNNVAVGKTEIKANKGTQGPWKFKGRRLLHRVLDSTHEFMANMTEQMEIYKL